MTETSFKYILLPWLGNVAPFYQWAKSRKWNVRRWSSLALGEGECKLPGMVIPWPFPQAGAVIQSLTAQLGSRTLGQTQLLQGLELWENRWVLVLLQNVPNACFLTLGKSFDLLWCQCSDSRVDWFVFNLILVGWGESYEESNFYVSS